MMQFRLDGADVSINFRYENKVTMCYLQVNQYVFGGYALCSSKDNYSKEKGRKISLSRALEMAGIDKAHRRAIWLKYHSRNEIPDDMAHILGLVPEAEFLNNFEEILVLANHRNNEAAVQLQMDFED